MSARQPSTSVPLCIVAFLTGMVLMIAAESLVAKRTPHDSNALEWLKDHHEEIDFLVIGPSFTRLHFLPDVFDEEMKKGGRPVYSFGFSRSGLYGQELDYYVDEILKLEFPHLRHVLIDITLNQKPRLAEKNWFKRRTIAWHTPQNVLSVIDDLTHLVPDWRKRFEKIWVHTRHGLLEVAQVGMGARFVELSEPLGAERKEWKRSHFYQARGDKNQVRLAAEYRSKKKKDHENRVRRILRNKKKGETDMRVGRWGTRWAARWQQKFEKRGIQVGFINGPYLTPLGLEPEAPDGGPLLVYDFNDPKRYPEYFRLDSHYDTSHMVYAGAKLFTRELAKKVLRSMERGEL